MDLIEIRPDFDADPTGGALAKFLAAQRAYERARLARVVFVHATALFGFPVWLVALGDLPGPGKRVALAAFALSLIACCIAAGFEFRSRADARAAERRL